MDQKKVDLLIQYILAVAAQGWGDFDNKEIGPIHIIKYVYLADLAYAEKNGGKTYTGLVWKFHHFGPWSTELFQRIEPAAKAIGAHKRIITDTPYDDFDRWSCDDDDFREELEKNLPISIQLPVEYYFKKFQTDTYDLLDHVYSTIPMLNAAPEEKLSFEVAAKAYEQHIQEKEELKKYQPQKLSTRARKKRKAALAALREKIQARKDTRKEQEATEYVIPTPPRYDKLYWQGQDWLDSLAGESIKNHEGEITVADNIWKSPDRTENVQ
jgi:hypothetical protein